MRRWRQRYQEYGYDGLFDRRLKRPSPKRVPLETVEKVLRLYREKYFDFNVSHFVEKLHSEEGIGLNYGWVKKALQESGLVAKRRRRGPPPQTAAAAAAEGDAAASGRQPAPLASGKGISRPVYPVSSNETH